VKTFKGSREPTFDSVAPFYPLLERLVFGENLAAARDAFSEDLIQSHRILLIGEGNGRFLKRILEYKKRGTITVVEKSSAGASGNERERAGTKPRVRKNSCKKLKQHINILF
jgi:hypothetical protein